MVGVSLRVPQCWSSTRSLYVLASFRPTEGGLTLVCSAPRHPGWYTGETGTQTQSPNAFLTDPAIWRRSGRGLCPR